MSSSFGLYKYISLLFGSTGGKVLTPFLGGSCSILTMSTISKVIHTYSIARTHVYTKAWSKCLLPTRPFYSGLVLDLGRLDDFYFTLTLVICHWVGVMSNLPSKNVRYTNAVRIRDTITMNLILVNV